MVSSSSSSLRPPVRDVSATLHAPGRGSNGVEVSSSHMNHTYCEKGLRLAAWRAFPSLIWARCGASALATSAWVRDG